jgi:tetratricopeptide (TPR) repeat protein
MSALKGIEMEGFRRGSFAAPVEDIDIAEPDAKGKGRAPLSQNESMGDLYFSMKNYDSALAEYEKVKEEYPEDKRLNLKISICSFNRGVNFIKSRKYVEAKVEFEKIGEDDPIYQKAKKKIRKIDKILREAETMGI